MKMPGFVAATLAVALLLPLPVLAGQGCEERETTPQQVAAAARTAITVADALEARDAPVALVARVGTDLSRYGLVYSHAGFAVRDHASGRWSVVHLLNHCGTDRAGLHVQGLVNFFADDLVNQDARIVWLPQAEAERLADYLRALPSNSLLNHNYNLLARPGSEKTQNSTAWVLETLAVTQLPADAQITRARTFAQAQQHGFLPDTIHVAYGKRVLGGMFSANTDFTDHPVSTRLKGDYPVVTVRSILRYMASTGLDAGQMEWRNGVLQSSPGEG
ncbi:hypothetical protein CO615_09035 [Lysobacteraceae bacterium NML75-0749]|nr:hypothetical protein CO615_09035 [Xanthomonadaceae bacterium NML75-0749]PJK05575.1 hypothetical protein CO609_01015 [Xanthomonadaceae bacterium NML91-0268]